MSNNNLGEIFYNFLKAPETYKNTVYVDSRGIPTVGLGYACIKKDKLSGGSGCDTYKFNLGDGYDTIIESFNESLNSLCFKDSAVQYISLTSY